MSQQTLQQAFVDGLGLPADTDFDSLAYGKREEWDSVGHMALVAELEAVFDIMLDTDDVVGMSSYPVAIEILRRYDVEI
jgi:acyl carrier protein